ncbi:hypothetical protein AQUCO_00300712v1 [Aquilegia coerulea]|uniref:Uncharacterized protein n=1 Tax=Aquilegia coerulea TaxID=218851 RepID=A0A2G5F022_AQUCA|nr:hypothetical protein AQUCO_00300712v1 [Aquilegia coerulea]
MQAVRQIPGMFYSVPEFDYCKTVRRYGMDIIGVERERDSYFLVSPDSRSNTNSFPSSSTSSSLQQNETMQFVNPDGTIEDIPCESAAVDTTVRIAAAGVIWGLTASPYDAANLGLRGIPRVSYVLKTAGSLGWQCGLFAGIYSTTRCQLQYYREKKDWINTSVAGALSGAIFAAKAGCGGIRFLGVTALISSIATAAELATNRIPSE